MFSTITTVLMTPEIRAVNARRNCSVVYLTYLIFGMVGPLWGPVRLTKRFIITLRGMSLRYTNKMRWIKLHVQILSSEWNGSRWRRSVLLNSNGVYVAPFWVFWGWIDPWTYPLLDCGAFHPKYAHTKCLHSRRLFHTCWLLANLTQTNTFALRRAAGRVFEKSCELCDK